MCVINYANLACSIKIYVLLFDVSFHTCSTALENMYVGARLSTGSICLLRTVSDRIGIYWLFISCFQYLGSVFRTISFHRSGCEIILPRLQCMIEKLTPGKFRLKLCLGSLKPYSSIGNSIPFRKSGLYLAFYWIYLDFTSYLDCYV